jgi:hypothetical protein
MVYGMNGVMEFGRQIGYQDSEVWTSGRLNPGSNAYVGSIA